MDCPKESKAKRIGDPYHSRAGFLDFHLKTRALIDEVYGCADSTLHSSNRRQLERSGPGSRFPSSGAYDRCD